MRLAGLYNERKKRRKRHWHRRLPARANGAREHVSSQSRTTRAGRRRSKLFDRSRWSRFMMHPPRLEAETEPSSSYYGGNGARQRERGDRGGESSGSRRAWRRKEPANISVTICTDTPPDILLDFSSIFLFFPVICLHIRGERREKNFARWKKSWLDLKRKFSREQKFLNKKKKIPLCDAKKKKIKSNYQRDRMPPIFPFLSTPSTL